MLSTRCKACHVKVMMWWLAYESQRVADAYPDETWRAGWGQFYKHHITEGPCAASPCVCPYNAQRAIEIHDVAGLIVSRADAREIAACLQLHLQNYSWLAAYSWAGTSFCFSRARNTTAFGTLLGRSQSGGLT